MADPECGERGGHPSKSSICGGCVTQYNETGLNGAEPLAPALQRTVGVYRDNRGNRGACLQIYPC